MNQPEAPKKRECGVNRFVPRWRFGLLWCGDLLPRCDQRLT
jgi:hypothetical protein